MEEEELEVGEPCTNCGTVVVEGLSPLYRFGDRGVLCWECAIQRGGTYDAEHESWVEPPRTSDLRA
jgi:hypothetical protein